VGEVDDGHAAASELALDGVAVGEGVAEGVRDSDVELLGWRGWLVVGRCRPSDRW
jgi:hypothetical protein